MRQARVLVVDDEKFNRNLFRDMLTSMGHAVEEAGDGEEAIRVILADPPDLILLDLNMPKASGFEVLEYVKKNPRTRLVPVIMLTGNSEMPERLKALELGVDDFLGKPFNSLELRIRVRSLLSLKQFTDDMEQVSRVMEGLATMVEARDAYTGDHGRRLAGYAIQVGRAVGMGDEDLKIVQMGGLVHDIGKIAVSDMILNKPGRLDPPEWECIRKHPLVGADMCIPLRTLGPIIPLIRHHHEKLDGSGYPDKLAGKDIPLSVRIISVVDVYDALATRRSYKDSWPKEKCLATLREEADRGWWDREIVETLATIVA